MQYIIGTYYTISSKNLQMWPRLMARTFLPTEGVREYVSFTDAPHLKWSNRPVDANQKKKSNKEMKDNVKPITILAIRKRAPCKYR